MTDTIALRPAQAQETAAIASMWTEASRLLAARGTDQWQYPVRLDNITKSITAQTAWIIHAHDGSAVGTVTLDDFADPRLWTPADRPDDAYYVHRLLLTEHARGHDIGSAVLDWASRRAARDGRRWLRLDAWTKNRELHRYYLDRGFRHVRTVTGPDIVSGYLLERDAGTELGRGPDAISL